MRNLYDIIQRPMITEKSTQLKNDHQTVAFRVNRHANQVEIKQAVEKLFKVKVESVHTAQFHGKKKRMGRYAGHRQDWKKAYVKLKSGEKMIELFDNV